MYKELFLKKLFYSSDYGHKKKNPQNILQPHHSFGFHIMGTKFCQWPKENSLGDLVMRRSFQGNFQCAQSHRAGLRHMG